MIELSQLTKSYNGTPALLDINLFIQEGEIFGIIGKSGAGKSTLLRCINLLERPDTGQVYLDGEDILNLSPKALRKTRHKTAMIFQHFNLVSTKTVYENIAIPMRIQKMPPEAIHAKVNELLEFVGLSSKAHAYPNELSGGQKQRVAIARALSCSPKILLCDEATSALDPETTSSILALLKQINTIYGVTIVLITHQMEVIKRVCHRLAVIENGTIVETVALANVFHQRAGIARRMMYQQLSPQIPPCLASRMTLEQNHKPLLRLFFEGEEATVPFISQTSRELNLDINILLANIDRFDTLTCGVLIVELTADLAQLADFTKRCAEHDLTVDILGYVHDTPPV
jgi:D-methionine transport system ATP-binding protein